MKSRFSNSNKPEATPAPTAPPVETSVGSAVPIEAGIYAFHQPTMEYSILLGETAGLLAQRVNAALADGWGVLGGVAVESAPNGATLYQAVVRMK